MTGQMTLPDTSRLKPESARDTMVEAIQWIDENRRGWAFFVERCRADARSGRTVRVKKHIEELRDADFVTRPDGSPFKVKNAFSAAFGRILVAWYPSLEASVPLASSKMNGTVIPMCPEWAMWL